MTTAGSTPDRVLCATDWLRVCRDLAWSEISAMPGVRLHVGPRMSGTAPSLDWGGETLALDSLARMQLATAAATWCNAYDSGFEDLFLAKRNAADWAQAMQRARAAGSRHFTFSTSGSTGARKHIRHQEALLLNEASAWAQVLGQPDRPGTNAPLPIARVVVLCPTHHIYGFIWGVLLPQLLGVPVVDADLDCLPTLAPEDLVVAVPDQWAWLADSARHWPVGVQGISSTAPLPDTVHRALATPSAGPDDGGNAAAIASASAGTQRLARLVQVYGSTETGGVAYRTSPDEPYTLAPQRSRDAVGRVALALPDGSAATLDLQDELQWTSDSVNCRTFRLLRRSDHSVQVGGHNVSPAWVADQLRGHPAVQQASVRLDTLAMVPRLKAFVVLTPPGGAAQQQALEEWIADTLPWYAGFSSIRYGAAIPITATGKPSDWPATE